MNHAKKGRKRIEWERLEISFKKIGAIKETFHARMGMIRDRNGKDLTELDEIKRSGNNKQKNYTRKVLTIQITTMVWSLT